MARESRYKQDGNFSQRRQRREQMFRDQHGRRYHASIEKLTGHPCGLIEPQFTAPLAVPAMYLELSNDEERPYDLYINYKRWKADIRTARREWEKDGRTLARKMYGDLYDAKKAFSAEVLDVIGPAPQPIEPVIAAEQGNRWVLGLSTVVDRRLVPFFEPEQIDVETPYDEPDFSDASSGSDVSADLEDQVEVEQWEDDLAEARAQETSRQRTQRAKKSAVSQTPNAKRKRAQREAEARELANAGA